jgi:WD40 repeat protein
LTVDPSDRFLLSGAANGNAFIWDTFAGGDCVRLPVGSEGEVTRTAWIGNQIACICDDLPFSLFNWQLHDDNLDNAKRAQWLGPGRQAIDCTYTAQPELSLPATPKKAEPLSFRSSPLNKSILEYFPPSPRL